MIKWYNIKFSCVLKHLIFCFLLFWYYSCVVMSLYWVSVWTQCIVIYIHYIQLCIQRFFFSPVGWGCRIHRLLLCRGVRPPPNECPGYDTKQSDGKVPAVVELWWMRSTLSLPSLPGPLWPGVVAPDKGPIYGLNRTKLCFFHYIDFCIEIAYLC